VAVAWKASGEGLMRAMAEARRRSDKLSYVFGAHTADWFIAAVCIVLWNHWGVWAVVVLMLARLSFAIAWKASGRN
jgi:hypothetical protein